LPKGEVLRVCMAGRDGGMMADLVKKRIIKQILPGVII